MTITCRPSEILTINENVLKRGFGAEKREYIRWTREGMKPFEVKPPTHKTASARASSTATSGQSSKESTTKVLTPSSAGGNYFYNLPPQTMSQSDQAVHQPPLTGARGRTGRDISRGGNSFTPPVEQFQPISNRGQMSNLEARNSFKSSRGHPGGTGAKRMRSSSGSQQRGSQVNWTCEVCGNSYPNNWNYCLLCNPNFNQGSMGPRGNGSNGGRWQTRHR